MSSTDTAPHLTPTEARQASPRRMNFRVLMRSMALALVAAGILYYVVYGRPESPIAVPKEPPATSAPAVPESAPPATPAPGNP